MVLPAPETTEYLFTQGVASLLDELSVFWVLYYLRLENGFLWAKDYDEFINLLQEMEISNIVLALEKPDIDLGLLVSLQDGICVFPMPADKFCLLDELLLDTNYTCNLIQPFCEYSDK